MRARRPHPRPQAHGVALVLGALLAVGAAGPPGPLRAAPAAAATTVELRVSGAPNTPALVPRSTITLPSGPVAGAPDSCSGDTALGALSAAVGAAGWAGEATTDGVVLSTIRAVTASAGTSWRLYINNMRQDGTCLKHLTTGDTVLFYLGCDDAAAKGCFAKEPSILTAPALAAPDTPFTVSTSHVVTLDPPGQPTVYTTEQAPFAGVLADNTPYAADDKGVARLFFSTRGPHTVTLSEPGRVPDSRTVCVTSGSDGYCGTNPIDPAQTPAFDVSNFPVACATNGHDGLCGTADTTGPAATVTSIKNKKAFRRRHGPGQVAGTVEIDPQGIKTVRLKLTRTATATVVVLGKKRKGSRKRTRRRVHRTTCTYWDDSTALLERTRRCGKNGGIWWTPDLDDESGNQSWSYHFRMTLPHGRYVLQAQAQDRLDNWGPLQPRTSVVVFTVK